MSNPNKNNEKSNKNKNQQHNKKKQPPNKNANQGNKKDDKPNKGNYKENKNIDKPKEVPIKEVPQKVEIIPKIDNTTLPLEENVESTTYAKYRRRKIETNWDKDELPENIYDKVEASSRGANMHELFNKPMSAGDHFQFKSEKHWNFGNLHPNDDQLFTLDFKKISEHVSCVPFYELIELDPSLFTESQVEEMKKTAAKNKLLYESSPEKSNILNSKICNLLKATDVKVPIQSTKVELIHKNDVKEAVEEIKMDFKINVNKEFKKIDDSKIVSNDSSDDDLDALLETVTNKIENVSLKNDTINQNVKTAVTPKVNTEEEDLEEWLNDYLG